MAFSERSAGRSMTGSSPPEQAVSVRTRAQPVRAAAMRLSCFMCYTPVVGIEWSLGAGVEDADGIGARLGGHGAEHRVDVIVQVTMAFDQAVQQGQRFVRTA